jgi:hypothetical protein
MAVVASNAGQTGTPDGSANPICAAVDSAVALARKRLWIAVPWIYTRSNNPWLLGLVERVAERARGAEVDVRAYLRPDRVNAHTVSVWEEAGVTVVQATARTRHLHSKIVVSDDAVLVLTANLTDTDLFRNANHFVVERDRTQVEAAAASVLLLGKDEPESPLAVELTPTDTLVRPGYRGPAWRGAPESNAGWCRAEGSARSAEPGDRGAHRLGQDAGGGDGAAAGSARSRRRGRLPGADARHRLGEARRVAAAGGRRYPRV